MSSVYAKGNRLYLRVKDTSGVWRAVASGLRVGQEDQARKLAAEVERKCAPPPFHGLPDLPPWSGTGPCVYFVLAPVIGRLKIGTSTRPDRRLRSLQTASAEPLKMLAMVAGDRFTESDLHDRLHSFRIVGEWFHATTELLAWIRRLGR